MRGIILISPLNESNLTAGGEEIETDRYECTASCSHGSRKQRRRELVLINAYAGPSSTDTPVRQKEGGEDEKEKGRLRSRQMQIKNNEENREASREGTNSEGGA